MDQELANWIAISEADLLAAKELLANPKILPALSVYHSHQCVEKLLKAILLKQKQSLPKIHNLNKLLVMANDVFPDLLFFEDSITELNELLPLLRYPTGDQISSDDANNAYHIAATFMAAIQKRRGQGW